MMARVADGRILESEPGEEPYEYLLEDAGRGDTASKTEQMIGDRRNVAN